VPRKVLNITCESIKSVCVRLCDFECASAARGEWGQNQRQRDM